MITVFNLTVENEGKQMFRTLQQPASRKIKSSLYYSYSFIRNKYWSKFKMSRILVFLTKCIKMCLVHQRNDWTE